MPVETNSVSDPGASLEFLNVGTTVGKNSVNYQGDVILIQAMFYEVLPYYYGISGDSIPYPTGTYDKKTEYLILKYQEMSSLDRGVKIWRDGFINRAVGSHVPGKKRVWTITYLNEDLYYVHTSQGYAGNYVEWLINRYPDLGYYAGGYA